MCALEHHPLYKTTKILPAAGVFIMLLFSIMTSHQGIGEPHAGLEAYTDEPKIYYRMARSETHGMFSNAGLLGFCDRRLRSDERKTKSISSYLSGNCPVYFPYKSQSGAQGFIYSLINKFYKNPYIFKILCASFLSFVLASWFVWLCGYFGLIPSFLIMISILSFKDLMAFGDNIAQVLGATYLIMVAMFWAYEKKSERLGTIVFFVVLMKLLLNGPEYIFSALLMPFLPLVFYSVLNRAPALETMKRFFLTARGAALASLVASLILMIQISAVDSPAGAIHHFILKLSARTFFPDLLPLDERLMATGITQWQLLHQFLSFPCGGVGFFEISFGMMILLFGIMSLLAFYLYQRDGQRVLLALLTTTWASILCPLSWILIAKGHSASQAHDALVWHMPFTLLGAALIVVTLKMWICGRQRT